MVKNRNQSKSINICSGPGCKAWDSDQVVRGLEKVEYLLENKGFQICRVRCMNKCGGGVSIRVSSASKTIKLRSPDRVWEELVGDELALEVA